ncbi:MAG: hypothetical protein Q8L38_07280, partial [Pseudohongiella sp.]|nr:hypothetical protein [Pseudohongiella sp.]
MEIEEYKAFDDARGIQKPFSDKSTAQKMAWKIPRHFHFLICNPAAVSASHLDQVIACCGC